MYLMSCSFHTLCFLCICCFSYLCFLQFGLRFIIVVDSSKDTLSINQINTLYLLLTATVVGKHHYEARPRVSRRMPRVGLKWVGRCCLSIFTLGQAYPMPRLCVHHLLRDSRRKLPMKWNSYLPNKYKKLNSTSTTKTKTSKYTRRLRCIWKTLLELKNTKKKKK